MEHFSATSLSMAITCPEQFRRRYLLKQREKLSGDRFLGIVDHSVHEWNFSQKILTGADLSEDEVPALYARLWSETIDNEGEPSWGESDPSAMYDRGLTATLTYHRLVAPQIAPLGVEERIDFHLPGVPIPVIGYLDVRTQDRLIDRKTVRARLKKPKSKWRMQSRIYSYATGLPLEIHLITKQATPQIVTASDEPALLMKAGDQKVTERFLTNAIAGIAQMYERFGPSQPWPTMGYLHDWACDYCTFGPRYEMTCGIWSDADPFAEVSSPDKVAASQS